MKGLIAGLVALALGLVLGATVTAYIAQAAILQPGPVLAAIPASTYPELAKDLPQALGQVTPLSADDKLILAAQIDPGLVRHIGESVITQEITYLHHPQKPPQLDLSSLAARLHGEGAPLPAPLYARLDQPISLRSRAIESSFAPLVGWLDGLRVWGPFVCLALAALAWLLGRHHRFKTLAKAALLAAVVVLLALVIVRLAPAMVSSGVGESPWAALAPAIRSAATAVSRGFEHQALAAAAGLAAAAVCLGAAQLVFGRGGKRHH